MAGSSGIDGLIDLGVFGRSKKNKKQRVSKSAKGFKKGGMVNSSSVSCRGGGLISKTKSTKVC